MTETPDFEEGEVYAMEDLPDSDMNNSGNLEMVGVEDGNQRLGFRRGDQVVTFVWSHVEVVEVKYLGEDGYVHDEPQ